MRSVSFAIPQAIAFHGTADPWADTARIVRLCEQARIPLFLTPNASHSLETGDVQQDIRILGTVMEQLRPFLQPGEAASAPVDADSLSVPPTP